MKVLITNVYSYKNKGDAAIVIALVSEVKRVFRDATILVQTADVANDEGKYHANVSSSLLWLLVSSHRNENIFSRVVATVVPTLGLIFYLIARPLNLNFLLTKKLKVFVYEQASADIIIACGGGYLRTASGSLHESVLLIITCLNFLVAHYLKRPVYLYSQSIGPVHGRLQRQILVFALNRVTLIESRELITTKMLRSLKLTTPVVDTADAVFLLAEHGVAPDIRIDHHAKLRVGVTVRKWFRNDADFAEYVSVVAKAIDYLIERHDAHVYYFPQVIATNFGDDDRVAANLVLAKVNNKQRFTLILEDLSPEELIDLCGHMDLFIGTRMHSNIFALINAIPVVAIEYEAKTRGIMEGLGMGDMVVSIESLSSDKIIEMLEGIIVRPNIHSDRIKNGLKSEIKKSRSGIELIKRHYSGRGEEGSA